MKTDYSVKTCLRLNDVFKNQKILRPQRIQRYEPGTEITFRIKGIVPPNTARLKLEVEKFVGGGFAGQVYKIKVRNIKPHTEPIKGIHEGESYAMKIFIPPSRFSKFFRNIIYAAGFQGAFSLQGNPDAVRAGALWQKFIRRGAGLRLSSQDVVADILATFVDPTLGSCGEISEWVDGRVWRLEADDNRDSSGEKDGAPAQPENPRPRALWSDRDRMRSS